MSGARRWIGYVAIVIIFSVACGFLAAWQFDRNEQAAERIRQIEENWDAAPVPLDTVLASPEAPFDPALTWTPVEVSGEYLIDETLLVRNRPRDGVPGYEVLVPFQLANGDLLIVNRGWLPPGERQAEHPDVLPDPMRGEQEIIVRLRVGEPPIPGRSAPEGQVPTIELALIDELFAAPVYTSAFGVLVAEPESTISAAPARATRPAADPGPHLSYAVQWILFAVMAGIALAWGVWNERRVRRLTPAEREAERYVRRAGRDADAEAEDALLDA